MPFTRGSRRKALRAAARVDWATMDGLTDKDIARQIANNPDAAPDTSRVPRRKWRRVLPGPDVSAIRAKLRMARDTLARAFGVSAATIRSWEEGHSQPQGPARALLIVTEREPEAVLRALRQKRRTPPRPRRSAS